jgi:hypothetical protein
VKTISVEVKGGLCNRLSAFVSGMCLAEEMRAKVDIYWPSNLSVCAAAFSELFEITALPSWVRVIDSQIGTKKNLCITREEAVASIRNNVPILSYAKFYLTNDKMWNYYMQSFVPKHLIIRSVKENLNKLPKGLSPIGIHIRRTDCWKSIADSPTYLFENKIRSITGGFFFLATDDQKVAEGLINKFPKRVYCHEKLRTRNTTEGIQEALVSLYTLACCSRILGSYSSTFTKTSAIMGGRKCEVMQVTK